MNEILIYIFFLLLFLSSHTYLFYPVIIRIFAKFQKSASSFSKELPSVSILISAFNEELTIGERVENIAGQDYDFSKLQLIIGSDCSSDKTNEILTELAAKYEWFDFFSYEDRSGKAGVLNKLVNEAKHEILVFTDANTVFRKDTIKILVEDFHDKKVGGVCGKLILTDDHIDDTQSVEEKSYWEYETKIKTAEGKLGILIGANGGNFAIRRELFTEVPIKKAVTDDFFISLSVHKKGYKFTYKPNAIAIEEVGKDLEAELRRKIRFAATNYQSMMFFKEFLFFKPPLVSFAYISHKLIRWFFPFIAILIYLTNLLLVSENDFFFYSFLLQSVFYIFALIGFILEKMKIRIKPFSFAFFFVTANYALIKGFIRFLKKEHSVIWQSTQR